MSRWRGSASLLLCVLLGAGSAWAQSDEEEETEADSETPAPPREVLGLEARSSTFQAGRWLGSEDDAEREKALKRLGLASDAQGIDLLIRAVQPEGQARTPRLRLVALRSLARSLDDAAVRRALVTLMSGAGQPPEAAEHPLEVLVRDGAAMALAKSGHPDALVVLGKALRQGGPTGQAAAKALTAYPPKKLGALLTTPGAASTNLVEVLAAIKDQRAFNALRSYATRGNLDVRARATLALTELGHMETVALARHWLEKEPTDPTLRLAAIRVLSMAGTDDAAKYLGKLFDDEDQRQTAARLAFEMPSPRLLPALDRALGSATPAERPLLFGAMGRAGGSNAARLLAARLASDTFGPEAAYALALAPGRDAERALVDGLDSPKTRRLCARALVMRARALGGEASELSPTLRALIAEKDPADRAAGAFGLGALSPRMAAALVTWRDPVVVIAAARSASYGEAAVAAARRLAIEPNKTLALALSNALNAPEARKLVPSSKLHELIQTNSAAASLAARALAARLRSRNDQFVDELSHSPSPEIRAEFALGLAEAPAPAATGLLREMYEFETDARVRRAVVAAVSQRPEASRHRILALARALDPDEQVRQLALLATRGHPLASAPLGHQTFWLALTASTALGTSTPNGSGTRRAPVLANTPVVVQGPRGHTLVALPDPDGFVGLIGLDSGPLRYVLADPSE
ncbi:MAG TPA: HEAT repeat domain-containing protein [Polyangiaceae bacterium]|nr:HEAT repeat domain-containing protein [Polyangiaceae bacterium]